MSRIRGRGNKDTELTLAKLLRKHGITGWRRQAVVRGGNRTTKEDGGHRRAATVIRPDFLFPKERVAVFVDGCFWHGCPKHSNPAKRVKKSSMPEYRRQKGERFAVAQQTARSGFDKSRNSAGSRRMTGLRMTTVRKRTGKAFWREKMAANVARDRLVNRELRKQGWVVIRLWEHELGKGSSQRSEAESLGATRRGSERIRRPTGRAERARASATSNQRVLERIIKHLNAQHSTSNAQRPRKAISSQQSAVSPNPGPRPTSP